MWDIVFFVDRRGTCPPRKFMDELPVIEQAKIRNTLRLLQAFGTHRNRPHAKQIKGKLWELRPGGVRLLYFASFEQPLVILHGYRKQRPKVPDREIDIAMRRMQELMDEVDHGSKEYADI